MDPLITNRVDPALMRVLEKRGQERDAATKRRRPPLAPTNHGEDEESSPESEKPEHELDDLA
jgi:hypothetical protein